MNLIKKLVTRLAIKLIVFFSKLRKHDVCLRNFKSIGTYLAVNIPIFNYLRVPVCSTYVNKDNQFCT